MDRHDVMIVSLREEPSQKVPNAKRMERCATILIDEFTNKNGDNYLNELAQALFNQWGRIQ